MYFQNRGHWRRGQLHERPNPKLMGNWQLNLEPFDGNEIFRKEVGVFFV